jgi:hypothetical protein
MVKFFSNSIPLNQTKFSDFAARVVGKQVTAQQDKPVVKTASAQPTQKVTASKKNEKKPCACGKKDCKDECKKPCACAEVEVELVKEASTPKKAEKEDKKDGCSAEAPSSGQLKVEPLHQKGESEKPSEVTDGNKKTEVSATKTDSSDNKEEKKDKEASTQEKFVRLAKLDGTTRNWLKEYWKNIFPAEYVELMLQEK